MGGGGGGGGGVEVEPNLKFFERKQSRNVLRHINYKLHQNNSKTEMNAEAKCLN